MIWEEILLYLLLRDRRRERELRQILTTVTRTLEAEAEANERYRRWLAARLRPLVGPLARLAAELEAADALPGPRRAALEATIQEALHASDRLARDLATRKPPADSAMVHVRLRVAVDGLRAALATVREEVRKRGSLTDDALQPLVEAVEELQATLATSD